MSVRISIYLDPGDDNVEDVDLIGPHIFNFKSLYATDIICGSNPVGRELYKLLESEEKEILKPSGRVLENTLELVDPELLRYTLMKVHDWTVEYLYLERLPKSFISDEWSLARLYVLMQREIAGAVFLCDQAIKKRKAVYWALG